MVRFIAMAAVVASVAVGAQLASACGTPSTKFNVDSLRSGSTMRCHSPRQADVQFRLICQPARVRMSSAAQEIERDRVVNNLAAKRDEVSRLATSISKVIVAHVDQSRSISKAPVRAAARLVFETSVASRLRLINAARPVATDLGQHKLGPPATITGVLWDDRQLLDKISKTA